MTETPPIVLGDERTKHEDGEFVDYLPVVIHAEDREMAREIAQTFSEAWGEQE